MIFHCNILEIFKIACIASAVVRYVPGGFFVAHCFHEGDVDRSVILLFFLRIRRLDVFYIRVPYRRSETVVPHGGLVYAYLPVGGGVFSGLYEYNRERKWVVSYMICPVLRYYFQVVKIGSERRSGLLTRV